MAMKPKKIISSRGESGVGAGPGRGSSGGGGGASFRKKISEDVTVKIKKKTADKVEKDMADLRKIFGRKTTNAPAKTKANDRGLKAANKPTKASKTFAGSNQNLSPSVRRDIIVNQTKPARPNRERGGSLKTLRKQGKTTPTPPRNKSK
jgi:hypothetical protein